MTPEDILYLRAELKQAAQLGVQSTVVRVRELQTLLDRYDRALAAAPADVKIFGFVHPGHVKGFREGDMAEIRVKRNRTVTYTKAVFHGSDAEVAL